MEELGLKQQRFLFSCESMDSTLVRSSTLVAVNKKEARGINMDHLLVVVRPSQD